MHLCHCYTSIKAMTLNDKSSFLLKSYGYLWLFYISFGILIVFLNIWFPELTQNEYQQTEIMEMAKSHPFKLFVMACLFAPILEEMLFRTLIKPSHADLILFSCSWPVFIGSSFLPDSIHWLLRLLFTIIVIFTLYTILIQLIPAAHTVYLRKKLTQLVIPILIISSLLFGLVHISNYVIDFTINAALILLVTPQIIAGCILGWVKHHNTHIAWSMGLHFMNNVVPVAILVLTKAFASQDIVPASFIFYF